MAGKGDTFENDLLKLIFQAVDIVNIADDTVTAPLASLFVALHTADPGETGLQNASEAAYGSYARETVARTAGGWTVTTNSVSPAANIDFTEAASGSETETDFSVGVAISGATKILYFGAISPTIVVVTGVTPRLTTATAITED